MKRVRKGSPKPTDGTADFPVQSNGRHNSRPDETWTLLRVKIWRLRQRAAARLRRSVRNARKLLHFYEEALSVYSNKDRPQVSSLASFTVNGQLQLRLRFVRGSYPDEGVVSRGGITGDRDGGLRSTLARRAMYHARTVVSNFAQGVRATTLGIVGLQCLLCGSLYHSSWNCLSEFERTFFLAADHLESAITRMRDVSIREEDWSDDFIRIGVSRLEMRKAQDARLVGLLFWFGALMRHAMRTGGLGIVLGLLRYPSLANELWRVLTGSVVLPEPPRSRLLLHRIWGSEGLYDFAYQELRRRGLDVQYPGPETVELVPDPGTQVMSTAPSGSQDGERDTVSSLAGGMVLSALVDTQLELTVIFQLTRHDHPLNPDLVEQVLPLVMDDNTVDTLVCPGCRQRAWYGSTCSVCPSRKPLVRSLDSRLWRVRPNYVVPADAEYYNGYGGVEIDAMLVRLLVKYEELAEMMSNV